VDPRFPAVWGLCALAFATSQADAADEPPSDTVTMEEVTVRLPKGEIAQAPAAAATVVEADRFAGEAKGVAELVAVSPGVDVERYGAAGQLATVSIRGVAADGVKVFIDGLPLGGAAGWIDLSTIPRAWIRRIEVVRGPAGAFFGVGALGGAVNVVTRSAAGASAEASAGSFGTYQLSADAGARLAGWSLLAGAAGESTRGDFPYRYDPTPDDPNPHPILRETARNDASQRGGLLLKLGGTMAEARVDALVQVSGGHRQLPGPVANPTPGDWEDDGRGLAMIRVAREFGSALTLSARVHGRAELLDVRVAGQGTDPTRQRGGAGGLQLEAELRHGGAHLSAIASAEDERFSGTALGGERRRATVAATLNGELALGSRVNCGAAVRAEQTGPFTGASGNLGFRVALPANLRLRASAGRTYRVPSFTELYLRQGALEPNPDLRPASGVGGDAALLYDGPLGLVSLGGFAEREDDIITYEPASLGRFKPQNTQAALLRGLEVEVASAPLQQLWNLSAQLAGTLLRSEVLSGPQGVVGKDLPRRPREQLFARLAVAPSPFEAHVELRRTRVQFQDRYDVKRLPDASTVGAGASVRFLSSPRASLHVQIDNLTDRRDLVDGFGNPLPGRSVMVTLRAGASEPGEP